MTVKVKSLSKVYNLFDTNKSISRQLIKSIFLELFKLDHNQNDKHKFVAIDDISFSLKKGETLGIIGNNGAGKSTLLKILAGVLKPTYGSFEISGNVGSILELGTAFDLEYTGYENIELYSNILNYNKDEFEKIILFADLGQFLHQQLKHYSTGMLMRLAFSIQTSVYPDVMIIDEALSVGDINFQAKCFEKIKSMQSSGTTFIFVSHSLNQIREICNKVLLLEKGKMIKFGNTDDTIHTYQKILNNRNNEKRNINKQSLYSNEVGYSKNFSNKKINFYLEDSKTFLENSKSGRFGNQIAEIQNVILTDERNEIKYDYKYSEKVNCYFLIKFNKDIKNLWICYKIRSLQGIDLIHADNHESNYPLNSFKKNCYYLIKWSFNVNLVHGHYSLGTVISKPSNLNKMRKSYDVIDSVKTARIFSVQPRKQGLIGASVTWKNEFKILKIK